MADDLVTITGAAKRLGASRKLVARLAPQLAPAGHGSWGPTYRLADLAELVQRHRESGQPLQEAKRRKLELQVERAEGELRKLRAGLVATSVVGEVWTEQRQAIADRLRSIGPRCAGALAAAGTAAEGQEALGREVQAAIDDIRRGAGDRASPSF